DRGTEHHTEHQADDRGHQHDDRSAAEKREHTGGDHGTGDRAYHGTTQMMLTEAEAENSLHRRPVAHRVQYLRPDRLVGEVRVEDRHRIDRRLPGRAGMSRTAGSELDGTPVTSLD